MARVLFEVGLEARMKMGCVPPLFPLFGPPWSQKCVLYGVPYPLPLPDGTFELQASQK